MTSSGPRTDALPPRTVPARARRRLRPGELGGPNSKAGAVMVDPGLVTCPCNKENSVRLPGGWQVTVWLQSDGRRVVELCDRSGSLAGLMVSTRLPIVSIDWGWRGTIRDANGARRWWALAAGHFPAADSQPVVTFTRGLRQPRRTAEPGIADGLWMAADGLWVAAATGRYSAVGCSVASSATARHLTLTTARRPL